jgi:DNA-binding SARP family transcriptional activator/Tfp pilus assembly protein PilF
MIEADDARTAAFGELLRVRREAAALTQRDLARLAGVSLAAVRDLEQRRTLYPQPASVRRLSASLGLSGEAAEEFRRAALRPAATAVPVEAGADRSVRVLVLGPLVVRHGAADAPLRAARQRTLLGRLAMSPNEAVARSELIDLLWPGEPPEAAVNLVQTYVTRLRHLLAPAGAGPSPARIVRSGDTGYVLRAGPDELDLLRFRDLTGRARAARPAAALDLLDRALPVWRAAPASDVPALAGHPRALALTNERIQAVLQHADLTDRLGCHDRSLPALRALSEEHPLHEPIWGRLILALAAGGLQAAALRAYEEIRARLADELGIDPGPELADFHRRVLRQHWSRTGGPAPEPAPVPPGPTGPAAPAGPPPGWTRPLQTPAQVGDFTGRQTELRVLCELLRHGPAEQASVVVCAIAGPGGVGKTTLAVQAAHLLRAVFPDGQLYADLHGDGSQPARPIDVLSQSLRALGVEAGLIPTDEAECSAFYRSALAGRRMLIVLDNARDARQVRPLVPGAGGCGVLVTSRRRMVDLEGVHPVDLETMPVDEAVDLLARVAGPARVLDDLDATTRLVRLCGQLPLAVRIAGARLASRPNWTVDALAERLGDEVRRFHELRAGDLQVAATFQLSYQSLAEPAARAFRLLAVAPIAEWSAPAAAALLGLPRHDAEDVLDDLVDCSLLLTPAPGRYIFHDLLRLYARNLSVSDDGPTEQADALERLYAFYSAGVADVARLQHPNMVRLPGGAAPGRFQDCDAGLAWLRTELPQIISVVEHAAAKGPRPLAWTVADQLRGYFFSTRLTNEWFATGTAGLAAAQQAGDRRAQAAMYQTLGQASWSIGDFAQSLHQYRLGLALAESVGWYPAVGYIHHNIGLVHLALGEPKAAQRAYLEALTVCRRHRQEYVAAVTLNDLAMLCWELGRFEQATEHLATALALNQRGGNVDGEAINRHNLGQVMRELGRFDEALVHLDRADDICRQTGSRYNRAAILEQRALLHAAAGRDPDTAITLGRAALDLMRATQDRPSQAGMLVSLGTLLFDHGDPAEAAEAAQCMHDAYALAKAVAAPYLEIRALIGLVAAHLHHGDVRAADDRAEEALRLARDRGYRMLAADALVACAQAGRGAAGDLYDAAARICRDTGDRPRMERIERLTAG